MLARRARGFSLIELLIAIAILATIVAMGLPSFNTFIANSRLRATTEVFYTGLQQARTAAVQNNAQVQFVFTTDNFDSGINPNTTNLATVASGAISYLVRMADPAVPGNFILLGSKSYLEGSGQANGGTPPVQVNSGGVSTITFTPLGATTLGATATVAFTNPTGGACATTGPMRCLNVVVSVGGQVKMCDPAVTAAGDTRKC